MILERESDRLLKAEEVARVIGLSRNCVYQLGVRGEIPPVRLGAKVVRFREGDVAKFIDERRGK